MGLNSPRMASGASGFMSNESCWPRPPLRRITITDRARPVAPAAADAFRAASRPGSDIPSSPDPAWTNPRRVSRKPGAPDASRRFIVVLPPGEG